MILGEDLCAFLDLAASYAYEEPETVEHRGITAQVWERIKPNVPSNGWALDIGCGRGYFIAPLVAHGLNVAAISLSDQELVNAVELGASMIFSLDMHKLGEVPYRFHVGHPAQKLGYAFVVARHVLEHSPIPMFVLAKIRNLLADDGRVYVEVPCPGTSAQHELNQQHFSVLTPKMWESLFLRTGLIVEDGFAIDFEPPCGPDRYQGWLLRKGESLRTSSTTS